MNKSLNDEPELVMRAKKIEHLGRSTTITSLVSTITRATAFAVL